MLMVAVCPAGQSERARGFPEHRFSRIQAFLALKLEPQDYETIFVRPLVPVPALTPRSCTETNRMVNANRQRPARQSAGLSERMERDKRQKCDKDRTKRRDTHSKRVNTHTHTGSQNRDGARPCTETEKQKTWQQHADTSKSMWLMQSRLPERETMGANRRLDSWLPAAS